MALSKASAFAKARADEMTDTEDTDDTDDTDDTEDRNVSSHEDCSQ